jgi:uncharacterized protein YfaT (DUF1175 family)
MNLEQLKCWFLLWPQRRDVVDCATYMRKAGREIYAKLDSTWVIASAMRSLMIPIEISMREEQQAADYLHEREAEVKKLIEVTQKTISAYTF